VSPDSTALLLVVVAVGVVTAVVVAVALDRPGGRARRVLAVLACATVAAAAAAVALNRELEVYPSWTVVGAAADGRAGPTGHGSRIVRFVVPGRSSRLTMTAYAYLPAAYASRPHTRFPVVEALDGYPGSPYVWIRGLGLQRVLDREIAAGRMAPVVVVMPYQTPTPTHDTECVDAVGGMRVDTFLTRDVRAAAARLFRVRTDRAAWGLIGYSTGGFCVADLLLRHPDRFAAAASLSGYFNALTDHTTGDLYRGRRDVADANSPLWRLGHLPVPAVALYAATARDDRNGWLALGELAAAARAPLSLTTAVVPRGGHSRPVWRVIEAPAFDWLSSWLAAPAAPSAAPSMGRRAAG
jgi:poly(3-hydroxybutyrate) depolymerase